LSFLRENHSSWLLHISPRTISKLPLIALSKKRLWHPSSHISRIGIGWDKSERLTFRIPCLTKEFKRNREQLLLQYCELDTAAMVMIWAHWTGHAAAAMTGV
jgi:hypothetical protein